jgi:EAL domain-containing protein (putative c-di-GMP-specific phosphodiesterase class I)
VGRNISPAEFIPVAEKSQLIHLVGLYVLDCVCQDVPLLPQVPVNINVSARQLMIDSFLADYLAVIAKHAVSPERFIIEITESSLLQGTREFANKILAIREAGIKIALDDFGMGFSEFNQLRTIPFDIIKIDKSFIQNIGSDHVTDVFVRAVVLIANQLRRDVIAEGIETAGEEQRAADVGCRIFQGYHYERPVPLQQLVQRYGNAAVAAAA